MERSEDWIRQAASDLAHARNDIESEFYDWACFSAQQAAEKAVKAVFQRMGAEAWGHSVTQLLTALQRSHPAEPNIMDAARELDQVYVPTRYPNGLPAGAPRDFYTLSQAERMVEYADRVLRFCEDLLASL